MNVVTLNAILKVLAMLGSLIFFSVSAMAENTFNDPLETPAATIEGAQSLAEQPIISTALAGQRLVAVGLRGLIILSDDEGDTWRQARVPVQSDLTAVVFPTADVGFAVGHDGVILTSRDAGESWQKKLDGNTAPAMLEHYYQRHISAGDKSYEIYLDQVRLNSRGGAVLPYLGAYFESEKTGYVVGAFGAIIKTEDGGDTWFPLLHRLDNPDFLHLNDIREVGGNVFIVGEQGTIWKWDAAGGFFEKYTTSYGGSLFGVVGNSKYQLVFGLGGSAFRSDDSGATWHSLETGTKAALTGGDVIGDGLPVLLTESGGLLVGNVNWNSFAAQTQPEAALSASVKRLRGDSANVAIAGYSGIVVRRLPSNESDM